MIDILELTIERPVAGGRMLARHDGRIVLVDGAIPGERVRARVERRTKQMIFASTTEVIEASPDRRVPAHDPACGGAAFAHVAYARQLELKQQILIDAFRRLARTAPEPPVVAASPERGYRLRARLHVAQGRVGYFREGTHTICDAAATFQLSADAVHLAQQTIDALGPRASSCAAVIVSENVDASERVLHLESMEGTAIGGLPPDLATRLNGVTGVTSMARGKILTISGRDAVTDRAEVLFGGQSPIDPGVSWTRRAPSFFQANRYLVGRLVRRVLESIAGGHVIDLYAGVGLFSVALAASGARVIAVEGEPFAVGDLRVNATPWPDRLEVVAAAVEDVVGHAPAFSPSAVVVDPPRTGLSAVAAQGLAAWAIPQIVYVSCDPPTLARDAGRLAEAGYRLQSIEAFDLFPNTPHVEALAVFTRIE